MTLRCTITTRPHAEQRYDTCGDWIYIDDSPIAPLLLVTISDMGNEKFEAAVAIHEFVEALLCRWAGIDEAAVTDFDFAFELRRERGEVSEDAEPGDDPAAPYHAQHKAATLIERRFCLAAGIDWNLYEAAIAALE